MRHAGLLRYQYGIRHEPSLQKITIASILLHFLLVSLIGVPLTSRQKEFRSYFVDIVGPIETPDIESGTPSEGEAGITQKSLPIGTDVSLKTLEKVSKEIERLRAIEKLSTLKSLRAKTENIQIVGKKRVKRPSDIYGQGIDEDIDSYYSIVTRKIWQQWAYPDFKASGLELIISIKIDREGKIISQMVEKASGNVLFDRSAMKAISKASPLPPPPIEMEIGVRFYL